MLGNKHFETLVAGMEEQIMTNPVTAVDLARYDTEDRRTRAVVRRSRRWRARTGAALESWGRRLRATEIRSPRPTRMTSEAPVARVTVAGAR